MIRFDCIYSRAAIPIKAVEIAVFVVHGGNCNESFWKGILTELCINSLSFSHFERRISHTEVLLLLRFYLAGRI